MHQPPGFTAEAALYKISKRYQPQAAGLVSSTDGVVPAAQCCAPCGKDLCCDECPPDPNPGPDGFARLRYLRFRAFR
jgi:hypothetical protein